MKFKLSHARFHYVLRQRTLFITLCFGLVGVTLLQTIILFFKEERVVIVPTDFKQGFWVEGNQVSPSYLEEMALFMSSLCLNLSPATIAYQRDVLLRHTHPSAYGTLKQHFMDTEKRLQKDRISMIFRPLKARVSTSNMGVYLTGDLITWVGQKQVTQARETYRLRFHRVRGQLQLLSFKFLSGETL